MRGLIPWPDVLPYPEFRRPPIARFEYRPPYTPGLDVPKRYKVLFWLGVLGEPPAYGNRSYVVGLIRTHVARLRRRGYRADFVGGLWDDLRRANRDPELQGLWAGAHGGCKPYAYCYLRTFEALGRLAAEYPHVFCYVGSSTAHAPNNWEALVGKSPWIFTALSVCHCTGPKMASAVGQIESWYATGIGQSASKVSFCRVNPGGFADDPKSYADSLADFVKLLP